MFRTQKHNEELVTVRNEYEPVRASGGVSRIDVYQETGIRMVMLPDQRRYVEDPKGFKLVDYMYAHVSREEMTKADMIPGKTKIIWNGDTWRVQGILDYRMKDKWQLAEITLVKHIGNTGSGLW